MNQCPGHSFCSTVPAVTRGGRYPLQCPTESGLSSTNFEITKGNSKTGSERLRDQGRYSTGPQKSINKKWTLKRLSDMTEDLKLHLE